MTNINKLRKRIDDLDNKLVKLLDQRARLALEVGEFKRHKGLTFFDPSRQKTVIQKAIERSTGDFPSSGIKTVFGEIMSHCLALERPIRIGFLGPEATFSHMAARKEFGSAHDFQPLSTTADVFTAVQNEWMDYGVAPIENSTGGIVYNTLDLFAEFELKVCSEIMMPIHIHLLSKEPLRRIQRIYSHPQPFLQCEVWLRENLPNAERIEVDSTVRGVLMAKNEKNAAAIGSELASELYSLKIIARGVEDHKDNTTRFLVISHSDGNRTGRDKTSIMFSAPDKPGALFLLLKPFAERGINLTQIESRPTRKRAWEYMFFVDMLGHRDDPPIAQTLKVLRDECKFLKILGSYPRCLDAKD
ncbi:MAG: prephenate dehydratase [Candidatus Sumerlaeota bacterium]|nr:prephenate dehydratase [Candidatus Sumerlaeota bacterium]